jgi:hypothetical protein
MFHLCTYSFHQQAFLLGIHACRALGLFSFHASLFSIFHASASLSACHGARADWTYCGKQRFADVATDEGFPGG